MYAYENEEEIADDDRNNDAGMTLSVRVMMMGNGDDETHDGRH